MNIKQMEYTRGLKREVLANGKIGEYEYYVMNLGTHPTAYVEIPKEHRLCGYKKELTENVLVHGGITYIENELILPNGLKEGFYIGWDYAHYGDYVGFYEEIDIKEEEKGKKYTTQEILDDVMDVTVQLDALNGIPHYEK